MKELFCCILVAGLVYCVFMMYRNELVCAYRLRYLDEFGPHKYEDDMPSYDAMFHGHKAWGLLKLRRYVKRGEL